jgi:molecular chaperone DnaK (HSP70)
MRNDIIVGIDLGTTNSEICIFKDSKPELIKVDNDFILPSVVGLNNENKIIVGKQAKNQYIAYPEKTIKSIKRKMGQNIKIKLGDKEYLPQEISSMILKKLKNAAEEYLGHPVKKAVITVPAYFEDAQKKATRQAAELAGLDVVRIINEPTAAALIYETNFKYEKKILVYDLGGGTFDVSLIQVADGVIEVLSSKGNNNLGGDDFDELLFDLIVKKIEKKYDTNLKMNPRLKNRLIKSVESCKKNLSFESYVEIKEEFLFSKDEVPINVNLEISRTEYETEIYDLIEQTIELTHETLNDINSKVNDIDEIILVGGSSRTPLITERLKDIFSLTPHSDFNPETAVALGASIQGAIIKGENIDLILIDVTPYTFGTSSVGIVEGKLCYDKFTPIIHKNTALPTKGSKVFGTLKDGQEAVEVTVYQGENKFASKNVLIGKFLMEGLADEPAGNEIVFTLSIDLNGLLHVIAEEKKTGYTRELTIENAFEHSGIVEDNVTETIKHIEYSNDSDNKNDIDKKNKISDKYKYIFKSIKKIVDNSQVSDDDKNELNDLKNKLNKAIEKNNVNLVNELIEEIDDLIFYLED